MIRGKKEEERSLAPYFLVLTMLLIFFSGWVLWEEVLSMRPWKAYQKFYYALRLQRTNEDLQKARQDFRKPEVQREYERLKSLVEKERVEFHRPETQSEYRALQSSIRRVEKDISSLKNEILVARNRLMEQEYLFMKNKKQGNRKRIEELQDKLNLMENREKDLSRKRDELRKAQRGFTHTMEEYSEKLEMFPQSSRIRELENLAASLEKPKVEIKQYYIEDMNRVDRCTSCHVGIENPSQKDFPEPFTTHPAGFIYLENHPPQRFGCTICHQGQGRATTSVEKAHGRVEFWEDPMFEGEHAQASCQHCHEDLESLKGAESLKQGDKILKKSVCFGCHRIDGYEQITKISPPLSHIGEKVSYTWLVKWLQDPSKMMEEATMPNYDFSEEDAHAIASYLFSLTKKERKDELVTEDVDWDLYDKGKIIYSQSICSICHSANGRGGAYRNMYAPDLSFVGSKVQRGWLENWLRNPKDYFTKARMSRYRFTEEEIRALVEYLTAEYVDWDLEEVKLGLSSAVDESMKQKGAALIREYGCFGCHDIEGMRDVEEIGPLLKIDELEEMVADELTSFGDKPMQEFDFGKLKKIEKARTEYLRKKLEDPRAFRDDAKMPRYNLSEGEREALITLILGFSKEEPLARYRVARRESDYEPTGEFAEILEDVQCLSCHKIYGRGNDYAPDLSIEGSRVKEEWLRNYLQTPDIIRPMIEQMPKFNLGRVPQMSGLNLSRNEIDILTDYIMTVLVSDDIDQDFLKNEKVSQVEIQKGRELYLNKGCRSCHQIGQEGGAVGPALTEVGSRLTAGYVFQHLLNPTIINRNTVEPDLGLSKEEALALTKFLMTLKGRAPW